jgi:hypothetical protein
MINMFRKKTNLERYAKDELDRLLASCSKDGYAMQKAVNRNIMQCVTAFCKERHSGSSAAYSSDMLNRLLNWLPLQVITKEDIFDESGQCNRCFALFKEGDKYKYTHQRVFELEGEGVPFNNSLSSAYVELPFYPPVRPDYVVIHKECHDYTQGTACNRDCRHCANAKSVNGVDNDRTSKGK